MSFPTVISAESRARQYKHCDIETAAHRLHEIIDAVKPAHAKTVKLRGDLLLNGDLFLTRSQKLMNELYRHRSFADCGRDALDRTLPHIAGGKNARHCCLQKKWLSLQWPGAGLSDLLAGLHEPLAIEIDSGRQPFRVRHRTDEDKHGRTREFFCLTGFTIR
jgi:hypothetical protein